ncbi:MAG TPA: hypothetical protein VKA06_02435, partial [Spirochaetia bacterium]|nr:hypothetical protein [Spirochaetia bacterium]
MANGSSGNSENLFSGDMDPEVAALIGSGDDEPEDADVPDFTDLFEDSPDDGGNPAGEIDMSVTTFARPRKIEEES